MEEWEFESFTDLAVIASFVQSLPALLSLPPINLKKGQIYVSRSKELAVKLDPLKTQNNLADFVVSIDNPTEPDMAKETSNTLDQFIVDTTGIKMGFLYQDLNENYLSVIDDQKIGQNAKSELRPLPIIETPSPEV